MRYKPYGFEFVGCSLILMLMLSLGCEAGQGSGLDEEGPTYYGEIRSLLDANCNGCHAEGRVAPFALDNYAGAVAMAEPSLLAIEQGQMPPWQPDPDCRHFANERLLSASDKALFRSWVEAGTPEGVASTDLEPEANVSNTFEVSHIGRPEGPYTPSMEYVDDYRCFPLDLTFEEDMYLRASEVKPGAGALVHHVLVYVIQPQFLDLMNAMDAYDPGPGYTCFGGGEVGSPSPVGAWVPGIEPILIENDAAIYIAKGSRVVMQVHYNLLVDAPQPDRTEWHVRMSPTPPAYLLEALPFVHRTLEIAAGDPESVNSKEFVNKTKDSWKVVSLGPHMHLLGVRIEVEHITKNGDSQCLIDIPDWDFNWQQNYTFRPNEPVEVAPGDSIRLTCTYNNSVENQPSVNGIVVEPRDVSWGDGTLDEMCLSFLTLIRPFEAPVPMCRNFSDCDAACLDGTDFTCVVSCMSVDFDCAFCMIPQMFTNGGCVDIYCKDEMDAVDTCFLDCASSTLAEGGDTNDCMIEMCPQERDALDACASPVYAAGFCDAQMVGCGAF